MSAIEEAKTRDRIARLVTGEMDFVEYRACLNEGHVAQKDTVLLGVILLEPWPLPKLRHRILSDREMETLQALAEGKTNEEIAKECWLATETIKKQVRSILAKLHARSRAHAVAIGFRSGLLVVVRSQE